MNRIFLLSLSIQILGFLFIMGCTQPRENANVKSIQIEKTSIQKPILIDTAGLSIRSRFAAPPGYFRDSVDAKSFANYLRNLPLKPHGSQVNYYNGDVKRNEQVYEAVVDLKIGKKDLHQCADAVMRLRAEFLWKQGYYSDIHFNFTNGFRVDYAEWMKGKRIVVKGNLCSWKNAAPPSNTYEDLWAYLEVIFTYAGTLSLAKELLPISIESLNIGDVFIVGGSPGHAVIVVDRVINKEDNSVLFLLAQSYMPAQEIQVLKNPADLSSPWYELDNLIHLQTPEWAFSSSDLKRF